MRTALLLVTGALVAWTAPLQRYASDVDVVRIDVAVDLADPHGGPLTADDFVVRDDGRPQRVTLYRTDAMPINVVLLLDTSRSTAGRRLEGLARAGISLVDDLRAGDRAALITFSDLVQGHVALTDHLDALRSQLNGLEGVGRTSLFDSVLAGLSVAEAASGRTLMLVCSDGVDNTSFLSAEAVKGAIRGSGVVIYTVNTGPHDAMGWLAEGTGGAALSAATSGGLSRAFITILDRFRRRYLLGFSPGAGARRGWHRLEVRLATRRGRVHHRAGYWYTGARPGS